MALEIVKGKSTPLIKAIAVINYLRTSFQYNDSVEIPEGLDPVEWFLFEGQEGFCNYFASAEVLMLRSLGIPSRIVVRYAQGEAIENGNQFLIRIKDGHSWVEVFFPDIGWIVFESTPFLPAVEFYRHDDNLVEEPIDHRDQIRLENERGILEETNYEDTRKNNGEFLGLDELQFKRENWPFSVYFVGGTVFLIVSILLIAYLVFFRIKPINAPIIIHNYFEKNGARTPQWVTNWSIYEQLSATGRYYRWIKKISGLIMPEKDFSETPHEFLPRYLKGIGLSEDNGSLFSDIYQSRVYGRADGSEGLDNAHIKSIYTSSLNLSFAALLKKIKREIQFRFRLIKIR